MHPASVVGSRKPLWERILPEKLLSREFPAPSLGMFVVLQTLDVLTTLIGLRVGAQEASLFVGRLMSIGPVAGLLISKILGVALVALALKFKRTRVIVFLNYWFAGVVSWNLATIVWVGWHASP
ncbi:MAG: DUF5658 family protein [Acidobacteriia bacterium]|nr:DUF5658 family protein [Terriglobia bacterium]